MVFRIGSVSSSTGQALPSTLLLEVGVKKRAMVRARAPEFTRPFALGSVSPKPVVELLSRIAHVLEPAAGARCQVHKVLSRTGCYLSSSPSYFEPPSPRSAPYFRAFHQAYAKFAQFSLALLYPLHRPPVVLPLEDPRSVVSSCSLVLL